MQAERPALLQDLSNSKLLLKYKKENSENLPQKKVESSPKDEDSKLLTPSIKTDLKQTSFKIPISSTSGVYDGNDSGVYGCDLTTIVTKKSVSKLSSAELNLDKNIEKEPLSEITEDSGSNIIVKNRRTSADAIEEVEKKSLISSYTQPKDEIKQNSLFENNEIKKSEKKNEEDSPVFFENKDFDFVKTKLEIVEDSSLISKPQENGQINIPLNNTNIDKSSNTSQINTTPRKPAFNPLHVILKDKNKYYTTEYI